MGENDRLRWRCRRGLLELDIVLSRFLDSHLDRLNADELAALGRLLDIPDNDLWDMVVGRQQAPDPGCAHLLSYLR